MYPVLTTNYKSFYSTFEQRIAQLKNSSSTASSTVSDLFYAVDTVVNNLLEVLYTVQYKYVEVSLIVYGLAMIILCLAIHLGSKAMNQQI